VPSASLCKTAANWGAAVGILAGTSLGFAASHTKEREPCEAYYDGPEASGFSKFVTRLVVVVVLLVIWAHIHPGGPQEAARWIFGPLINP
jgi:hypothetical protein